MSNDAAGFGMSFEFGGRGGDDERRAAPPRASFEAGAPPEAAPEVTRLVVLANLRGLPAARDRAPRRVRLTTLDEDFAWFDVVLRLDVKDHLGEGPRPLEVEAPLRSRADLRPDRLAAAIPALAPVVRLLDDLEQVEQGRLDLERLDAGRGAWASLPGLRAAADALDRALAGGRRAPSAPTGGALDSVVAAGRAAASGDAVLDSIFSMVDAGPAPAAAPAPTTTPISASTGSGGLAEVRAAAAAVLERQVGEVLRHPQTRQVDRAWRGLELVLSRGPREGGVEVEALDVDPDSPETALVHGLAARHGRPDGPPPPSLVLVDATFSRTAADVARLELVAEVGEALQAPIVVGVGAGFLGHDLPAFARLDHPGGALERGLEAWHGARRDSKFRWLVVATNEVLLRLPRGRGERDARRAGEDPRDLAWGNAGWLVLAGTAASHARTGWPSDLTGGEGELGDLPLRPAGAGGVEAAGPLAAALPTTAVEALADAGVLAWTVGRSPDAARLLRAPTAFRAPPDEPRWASGLPYQLVATRIAGALLRARERLLAGDPAGAAARVEAFARGLVGDTGPGAGATASVVDGGVEVEVTTGRAVLGGVTVVLGLGA